MQEKHIAWHEVSVTRAMRARLNGHRSAVIWFTGLPGAGKSTVAHALETRLHERGCRTLVLDGDNVRHGLCADLGFSAAERGENVRRIGEMVKLFVDAGVIAITAFISPVRADRARVRALLGPEDFIEVYCRCPLGVCEQRDIKGNYRKARAGQIEEFTGISAPYEEPAGADLVLDTDRLSVAECVDKVLGLLVERHILREEQT